MWKGVEIGACVSRLANSEGALDGRAAPLGEDLKRVN